MGRNTSHLAPSKRLKTYSGRSGSTGQRWDNPMSVKVRSGKNSQKEYINLRKSKFTGNLIGGSQSLRDEKK
jgi:hypothetical protein